MAKLRSILAKNPRIIEYLNNCSLTVQSAVADVLGQHLKTPVNPNSLPVVRIREVDSYKIHSVKPQRFIRYMINTVGDISQLDGIEIHPDLVIRKAAELAPDPSVRLHMQKERLKGSDQAIHLLSNAGMQLIVRAMLAPETQVKTEEINILVKKSVSLACRKLFADQE